MMFVDFDTGTKAETRVVDGNIISRLGKWGLFCPLGRVSLFSEPCRSVRAFPCPKFALYRWCVN